MSNSPFLAKLCVLYEKMWKVIQKHLMWFLKLHQIQFNTTTYVFKKQEGIANNYEIKVIDSFCLQVMVVIR